MIRAGALSYVLVISLIIATIFGSLIWLSYFHHVSFLDIQTRNRLGRNAESGFNVLLASPDIQTTDIDLFGEGKDSVWLNRMPWGVFEVGTANAHHHGLTRSITGMLGYPPEKSDETTLYLADLNRPLSLAGKTIINGNAFIPEAGVKRAYIERRNFVGNQLINGIQKKSNRSLPPLNEENVRIIAATFSQVPEDNVEGDSLYQPFDRPTLHVYVTENELRGFYKGNIVLYSNDPIHIRRDCKLEDVQVYAPEIIVESGFSGAAQFFAQYSIMVNEHVKLRYPSALVLSSKQRQEANELQILENSSINGVVIVLNSDRNRFQPKLLIRPTAILHGEAYVEGLTELHGSIWGMLYTEKFYLKTPGSIYENHILDAEIDVFKRHPAFVGSNIIPKSSTRKVMKWVN